jgi:hypothetical protein
MPTNQFEDIHTYVHDMHKYIVHVHVWLFLKIVQLNSLIMSYVHQLGIWSSDY